MKTEQENCTVTVRGIQRVEGDEDVVELVTGGRFTCHMLQSELPPVHFLLSSLYHFSP